MLKLKISKKSLAYIPFWVLFLFSFFWMVKVLFIGYYPDFNTQYLVPEVVLSGSNPYIGGEGFYTPQVYPPTTLFLYLPLNLLDITTAGNVFAVLSIGCLLVSLILLSKMFDMKFFSLTHLILMIMVFNFFPFKFTLGMGQMNNFILLILVAAVWFVKKGLEYRAGMAIGLSLVIKFFPLFLPIYLVVRIKPHTKIWTGWQHVVGMASISFWRQRIWVSPSQVRKSIGMLGGILTIFVFTIFLVLLFIPWELNTTFVMDILPSLFTSWKLDYYNQALSGFVGRSWGTENLGTIIKLILSSVLSLITIFAVSKNDKRDFETVALKFGTLITISILINNFSWQHHFVWLIIPFYATFAFLQKEEAGKYLYAVLGGAYLLISGNLSNPQILPVILQSHVFYGALLLLFLNICLLVSEDKKP